MFDSVAPELYADILETLSSFDMENALTDGALVGLSGGSDSVFLLCFLIEYRRRTKGSFNIVACHVNHMIRGDEAFRDMKFSRELADSLGIEFIEESYDVPALRESWGCGTEEAARRVRYSAFDEILNRRLDLKCVALAHNASDNLETVIFNMMRGSGLNGMCGIAPVRDRVVRPLIRISKSDILKALDASEINYVTDSSNLSLDYTRNYIRHRVVPTLYKLNSSPEGAVSRLTDSLINDNMYLISVAEASLENLSDKITNKSLLSLEYPILTRVLSLMCKDRAGISPESRHLKELIRLLPSDNFAMSIGAGYSFVCQRGICKIVSAEEQLKDTEVYFLGMGENKLDKYAATVIVGDEKADILSNVYNFSIHADIPSAIIKGDLFLRFRREGDSFKYKGHTRRLKKVFNDRNIPKLERDRIPIICDNEGILWVPGLGVRDFSESSVEKLGKIGITLKYNIYNTNNCLTTASPR